MLKELLLVGTGGFVGSILRYAVGRALGDITWLSLPWGTLAVNVAGCFLIGILSGLPTPLSAHTRLVLITGLCGGFTTFSTFMNEGSALMKDEHYTYMMLYLFGSLTLGLIAVLSGHQLAKWV